MPFGSGSPATFDGGSAEALVGGFPAAFDGGATVGLLVAGGGGFDVAVGFGVDFVVDVGGGGTSSGPLPPLPVPLAMATGPAGGGLDAGRTSVGWVGGPTDLFSAPAAIRAGSDVGGSISRSKSAASACFCFFGYDVLASSSRNCP